MTMKKNYKILKIKKKIGDIFLKLSIFYIKQINHAIRTFGN